MPTKEQMDDVIATLADAAKRYKERVAKGEIKVEKKEGLQDLNRRDEGRIGTWHPKIWRSESRGD
jgi:hypothetical protein